MAPSLSLSVSPIRRQAFSGRPAPLTSASATDIACANGGPISGKWRRKVSASKQTPPFAPSPNAPLLDQFGRESWNLSAVLRSVKFCFPGCVYSCLALPGWCLAKQKNFIADL